MTEMTSEPKKTSLKSMGIVTVSPEMAIAKEPKVIDFTTINVYPSRYKVVGGQVVMRSMIIENIEQQKEAIRALKTTVLIGDILNLDFKFGHYEDGSWSDMYVNGLYKVKEIRPLQGAGEILMRVLKI